MITDVFSNVKLVSSESNKMRIPRKASFFLADDKQTQCEPNAEQVTHEGPHYRISTTDWEFVSCIIRLRMRQLDYDNSVHTRCISATEVEFKFHPEYFHTLISRPQFKSQ